MKRVGRGSYPTKRGTSVLDVTVRILIFMVYGAAAEVRWIGGGSNSIPKP